MDKSELIVNVDGREAIPVRAIPFVTGWEISPDMVSKNFARAEGAPWKRFENMHAYHLHSGPAIKVYPKEWAAIEAALAGLQSQAHAEAVDDDVGYAVWRAKSASLLPAGVFVWKSEFEADWLLCWSRQIMLDEKEGDRELLYSPMMSHDLRAMVFEGFEIVDGAPVDMTPQVSPIKASMATPPQVKRIQRDILDPSIDKAIAQAGNTQPADVWLKLKEIAMANEPPYTGLCKGGALLYTDDDDRTLDANGKPVGLTKDSLRKRLNRRKTKSPKTD